MSSGRVFLVGAGPGDPGLITLRGLECIGQSDCIVYDRLVGEAILRHARPDAEMIYAGKTPVRHTLSQDEINALLVEKAAEGKMVCRLKGGDPYVFGRGGEEGEALRTAGIPFEVVPGITSAIAVPAYAGIPVTHRGVASSFAVVTGHEDPVKAETSIRWEYLAQGADTLVFLMGVENLPAIVEQLARHGRPPETPVALIRWGTRPEQRTLISTLSEVAEKARAEGFASPAVTVVGEVVSLRETLRWFDARPLFDRRILVTRAREQASELSGLLARHGAEPVEFPVIRIAPRDFDLPSPVPLEYDWLIFTSANGVQVFFDKLRAAGRDARAFAGCKVAAIGSGTAQALGTQGIAADFVPTEFVAEAVIKQFPENPSGQRILIPRAAEAREVLPDRLKAAGAAVTVLPVYDTLLDDPDAEPIKAMIAEGRIDLITFTSSSTVRNFFALTGPISLEGVRIVAFGPVTAQTVREYGAEVSLVPPENSIESMVETILEAYSKEKSL
ncbi:MAG: uroporphyrinogen-III C-methyltransferase [Armatimonadetes bacterium]|nr:uroporphyrinogen-III C-methyltransferase [Armatimonadota bacterium]